MKNKLLKYFNCKAVFILFYLGGIANSNAQIVAESFEGENFPPPGWTLDGFYTWEHFIGNASHGTNSIAAYTTTNGGVGGHLVSPPVTLEAGEQVRISFDYTILDTDGAEASLKLFTGTDPLVWPVGGTEFETVAFTEVMPYSTHTVTYTATEAGVRYFYFLISSTFGHPFSIAMDKILIERATECPPGGNATAGNVAAVSAVIEWESPEGVSEWQMQVTKGTLPVGLNWTNASASPMILDELTPGTNYTVYVRSKCGEEYSNITDPVSFTTPCQDVIEAPYTMAFNEQVVPDCWAEEGDSEWKFNLYADYGASDAGDHTLLQGATYYAWVDGTDNTEGKSAALISPLVNISALESPALEFYAFSSNKEGNEYNELLVEIFDGTSWEPVAILDTSSNGWKFYSIDLEPNGANVQARFTVTGNGELTFYNDILLDDISFQEKETCFPLQNVSLSNITSTTLDVIGESENTDATWDIAYGVYEDVFSGIADQTSVELPFTITGLEASTHYYIYIRANCGVGSGVWTGPFPVLTDCVTYAPPYEQNFDVNIQFPYSINQPGFADCWTAAAGGNHTSGPSEYDAGNWKADASAAWAIITNSESASVMFYGAEITSWLIGPVIDLSGGDYEAKVRVAISPSAISPAIIGMGNDDEVRFMYSTDGVSWDTLKTWTAEDNILSGYHTSIIPLEDLDGEVKFAFWASEGVDDDVNYLFHVDNLDIREKPICAEPVNLIVDGITNETAVLSWDGPLEATAAKVAVVAAGALPTDADWIDINFNPHVWEGLTADTSYDFYVSTVCGDDTSDIVTGPINFMTRCTPIAAPYTETFVEYMMTPECWITNPLPVDMQIFLIDFWNFTTTATADAAAAGDHTEGGNTTYAWLNTSSFVNQERARLTTALVDISGLENPAFQFYLFSKNTADAALNHVTVKIFNDTGWEELTTITSYTNMWAEHTLDLSAYAGNSPVQIQFEVLVNANGGYPGYNHILIDDVSFMEMPPCPAPFDITVSDITDTSALVSWQNATAVDSWEVEYGPAGFTLGEGIVVEVNTNPELVLNTLTQGEFYDVYVTALCGDENKTIGPAAFITETVSGVISSEVSGISCYPNPTSNVVNISSDFIIDSVEMYNIYGQMVKQRTVGDTATSIEIGALSEGMYLIKAYSAGNASVFRIIKK